MNDYATARAIRDAGRMIVLAIVLSAAFMAITLPIISVIVVHTAAKWQIQTMQADFQRGLDASAEKRQSR